MKKVTLRALLFEGLCKLATERPEEFLDLVSEASRDDTETSFPVPGWTVKEGEKNKISLEVLDFLDESIEGTGLNITIKLIDLLLVLKPEESA